MKVKLILLALLAFACNIDGPGVWPNNRPARNQDDCDTYVTDCEIHDGIPPWRIGNQYEITPLGGDRYEICRLEIVCK